MPARSSSAPRRTLFHLFSLPSCCLAGKGEDYQLFWPDAPDLVRLAARANATILPFSGVGSDEFFGGQLLDSEELLGMPLLGDWLRERIESLPSFVEDDVFVPPVPAPRLEGPRRNYFLFGEPMSTVSRPRIMDRTLWICLETRRFTWGSRGFHMVSAEMPRWAWITRTAVAVQRPTRSYGAQLRLVVRLQELRTARSRDVQDGINYLLAAREDDPFEDTVRRYAWEQAQEEQ